MADRHHSGLADYCSLLDLSPPKTCKNEAPGKLIPDRIASDSAAILYGMKSCA